MGRVALNTSKITQPRLAQYLAWAIIITAILLVCLVYVVSTSNPKTDAAEIEAPVAHISATVPGRIIEIAVENNARVNKGDVLFRIDPEPYQLRLDQARAELKGARSEVRQGGKNLSAEQSNSQVADKQVERARLNVALAQQTLNRLEPLLEKGYVTAQQVDQARTAYNDAQVSLDQALFQSSSAETVVGTLDTRTAQVAAAEAAVALAQRDLNNTVVLAPFDGKVSGLTIAEGEYALLGAPLFSLIDIGQWEAVGFFRETELANIAVGNAADVYVMSDPNRRLTGQVVSIGWGVRSQESATVLGMPVISNSLNWVKVAKRFPVYVHLNSPPDNLMRIGASAVMVVHSGSAGEHPPHVEN
jgi:membrane fusion protein, multidrug efflux system